MSQGKKALDFRIVDLLEQVQALDKQIAMYRTIPIDKVSDSMIKQYSCMRQEFADQINAIFNKFSIYAEFKPHSQQKKTSTYEKYASILVDLLEQVQAVDKKITMYSTPPIDGIAELMIQQNTVRRQEFIDQLNAIFSKFSMSAEFKPHSEQAKARIPKKYAPVELQLSMARENGETIHST